MGRFKEKKSSGIPKISTASLPDIMFILLCFFMVSTTMRETTLIVKIRLPQASEVQKLANELRSVKGVRHGALSMTSTGKDIE